MNFHVKHILRHKTTTENHVHVYFIECGQQSKSILWVFQASSNTFPQSCHSNLAAFRAYQTESYNTNLQPPKHSSKKHGTIDTNPAFLVFRWKCRLCSLSQWSCNRRRRSRLWWRRSTHNLRFIHFLCFYRCFGRCTSSLDFGRFRLGCTFCNTCNNSPRSNCIPFLYRQLDILRTVSGLHLPINNIKGERKHKPILSTWV